MKRSKPKKVVGLLAVATAALLLFGGRETIALTVTAGTSDNGYPAHVVSWRDSAGLTRTATMIDERATAPYTGFLRQYTYQIGGVTRVCTGSYNYATDGQLEFSGDGFVQNHTVNGGDVSTGNGAGSFPGTTTITLQGSSHAIITYNIPTYAIAGVTVPTTIQWFFADGRSHPIFAITQDASASPGNLGADSRSPYGDMAYDGATGGDPIVGNVVGGYSYGDTYKFVTLASGPEQVTRASAWKATESNTIPYAMQWADPAAADAEMGHVATLPISLSDQGIDTQTSNFDTPPDLFDPRTQTGTALPPDNTQAYQIINEPATLPTTGTTSSKRLTWGANYGRVGGFDAYDEFTDTKDYSQHSTDPFNQPLQGNRASGALMAYSVFVVLGPHSGSYETGTVGKQVIQMQTAAGSVLTASRGAVVTAGPAGVGNASSKTITYTPAGYDPTYSAWEISAAANAVNATLTPPAGGSLDHPIFVVDNYTAAQLPPALTVGPVPSIAGSDYFATLDTVGKRLWISVNRSASTPVHLVVSSSSSNAALSGLTLGSGTLSPVFSPGHGGYTATVSNTTASITVTPTVEQANATVKVNGVSVASGAPSSPVNLAVGNNAIRIVSTAQDGVTTANYQVVVTRLPSANAALSNLVPSAGMLSPSFSSGHGGYTASVPNATASMTVTPTVAQSNATIEVDGVAVASGSASGPIKLSIGSNTISIVCTAQNKVATAKYAIVVTRAGVPGALEPSTMTAGAATAASEPVTPVAPVSVFTGILESLTPPAHFEGLVELAIETKSPGSSSFTGILRWKGDRFTLHGSLDSHGGYRGSVVRSRGLAPLGLTIDVPSQNPTAITGTVQDSDLSTAFAARRPAAKPSRYVGKYSVSLPSVPTDSAAPQPAGSGLVTIDASGRLLFIGRLPDGTTISQATPVSEGGTWPVYASLYDTLGFLGGEVRFIGSDLAGSADWIAPSSPAFPNGIRTGLHIVGRSSALP